VRKLIQTGGRQGKGGASVAECRDRYRGFRKSSKQGTRRGTRIAGRRDRQRNRGEKVGILVLGYYTHSCVGWFGAKTHSGSLSSDIRHRGPGEVGQRLSLMIDRSPLVPLQVTSSCGARSAPVGCRLALPPDWVVLYIRSALTVGCCLEWVVKIWGRGLQ